MGEKTAIEWTESTWNPATGCTKVSAGCDNCYAHTLAERRLSETYLARDPVVDSKENREDPFAVRIWPERLAQPARWARPRMIFVNSMSDMFHAQLPDEFIREVFEVMLEVDRHIYQVLTKRPARALRFWRQNKGMFGGGKVPNHIWIGSSVESQDVLHRVDHLRQVPAEIRFLSCEPLLGPLELDLDGIHWVIAGGESGSDYRSLDLDWVRSIRNQCVEEDVPFFFKQVGGYTPKAKGRLLDGREWNQLPEQGHREQVVLV